MTRDDHLSKTRRYERELDNKAHRAGKDHHKEVEAYTAKKEAEMQQYATDQHNRAVRDENAWLNRRKSLQRSCDRQAKEAWTRLEEMDEETH